MLETVALAWALEEGALREVHEELDVDALSGPNDLAAVNRVKTLKINHKQNHPRENGNVPSATDKNDIRNET